MEGSWLPRFFYSDESHTQQGPITASELRARYKAHQLTDRTFVFAADGAMNEWKLIPQVEQLFDFCTTDADESSAEELLSCKAPAEERCQQLLAARSAAHAARCQQLATHSQRPLQAHAHRVACEGSARSGEAAIDARKSEVETTCDHERHGFSSQESHTAGQNSQECSRFLDIQAGELHDAEETTLPNSRYSTWGHSVSKASPKRGSCGLSKHDIAASASRYNSQNEERSSFAPCLSHGSVRIVGRRDEPVEEILLRRDHRALMRNQARRERGPQAASLRSKRASRHDIAWASSQSYKASSQSYNARTGLHVTEERGLQPTVAPHAGLANATHAPERGVQRGSENQSPGALLSHALVARRQACSQEKQLGTSEMTAVFFYNRHGLTFPLAKYVEQMKHDHRSHASSLKVMDVDMDHRLDLAQPHFMTLTANAGRAILSDMANNYAAPSEKLPEWAAPRPD